VLTVMCSIELAKQEEDLNDAEAEVKEKSEALQSAKTKHQQTLEAKEEELAAMKTKISGLNDKYEQLVRGLLEVVVRLVPEPSLTW